MLFRSAVRNHGPQPVRGVQVDLREDGAARPGARIEEIPAGGVAAQRFDVRFPRAGGHVVDARIAADARALLDCGERRVTALLERVQTKRVDAAAFRDIDPELESFTSVDTIEKYEWAIRRSRAPHRSPGA